MRVLIKEKLSEHKYKTPEGYLICTDAILARTGKQTYRRDEIFHDSDDTEIEVDRTAEEVFSPQTLASFENKPITVEHPDEDVNSENYKDYSVGFVRDVHQGKADGQDVILGTLVIQDAQTIEEIENGEHVELSCGYDCDIDDSENPQQRNIRGNHVALCECGRAGNARIVDSDSVKDADKFTFKLSKKKNEYDEYVIKAYKNGKYYEDASYYTDDWDDAVGTIKNMASRQGLTVKQQGSDYVADAKVKDSKYIVHFKHKNGGEDKDFVVEAKGMTEAVEIAKTYVSDYYYKYVNVKPYFGDSVKDYYDKWWFNELKSGDRIYLEYRENGRKAFTDPTKTIFIRMEGDYVVVKEPNGSIKKINANDITVRTRDSVKDADVNYKGYTLKYHEGYNMFINMRNYYEVYGPKGVLVGAQKDIDSAKRLVEERISKGQNVRDAQRFGITPRFKWMKGNRNPERIASSLEEARYIKSSCERVDGIRYIIFDLETYKVFDSYRDYQSTKESFERIEEMPRSARKRVNETSNKKAGLLAIENGIEDIINAAEPSIREELRRRGDKILRDIKIQFRIEDEETPYEEVTEKLEKNIEDAKKLYVIRWKDLFENKVYVTHVEASTMREAIEGLKKEVIKIGVGTDNARVDQVQSKIGEDRKYHMVYGKIDDLLSKDINSFDSKCKDVFIKNREGKYFFNKAGDKEYWYSNSLMATRYDTVEQAENVIQKFDLKNVEIIDSKKKAIDAFKMFKKYHKGK